MASNTPRQSRGTFTVETIGRAGCGALAVGGWVVT
jgi:hypothetical protein